MCRPALALLLLAIAASAFGADAAKPAATDLKANESLPWCRVTLNMAATIDRDAPDYQARDGWYDAGSQCLITRASLDQRDPFSQGVPGGIDPARIVKVETSTVAVPMPAKARELANQGRAAHAKEVAAKAADDAATAAAKK